MMRHLKLIIAFGIALGALVVGALALEFNVTKVAGVPLSAEAAAIRDKPIDQWVQLPSTLPEPVDSPVVDGEEDVPLGEVIMESEEPTSAPAPSGPPTQDVPELSLETSSGVQITPNAATSWSLSSEGQYYMMTCDEALGQACTDEQLLVWNYVTMSAPEGTDLFVNSGSRTDMDVHQAAELGLRACTAHYQVLTYGLSNGEAQQWLSHDLTDYADLAHDPDLVIALYEDAGQILCSDWL